MAWCVDPWFIPDEQVLFVPKPRVLNPEAAASTVLPGLRYLVRIRLVACQDWNTPPASPVDGRGDGGHDDDDGHGGGDASHNTVDGHGDHSRRAPENDYSGARTVTMTTPLTATTIISTLGLITVAGAMGHAS